MFSRRYDHQTGSETRAARRCGRAPFISVVPSVAGIVLLSEGKDVSGQFPLGKACALPFLDQIKPIEQLVPVS